MNNHPQKKGLTNDQFLEIVIASKAKVEKADIDKFIKDMNEKFNFYPNILKHSLIFSLRE